MSRREHKLGCALANLGLDVEVAGQAASGRRWRHLFVYLAGASHLLGIALQIDLVGLGAEAR